MILTPEGRKWNPYCTSYATNESAFTDDDGNLAPSEHIRQELIDDEDLNDETLDCSDVNAILAACEELNSPSKLSSEEAQVASAVVDSSLVYGEMKARPEWHGLHASEDEVRTKLASVNAALDPISFTEAVHNEAAISKFKMSIGSTTALPPEEPDNLWCDEPLTFQVNLNDLQSSLRDLEEQISGSNVAAVGARSRGVSPEHLSKVWGIDVETARRTIDVTSQHCKHDHPDHLRRQYSTNDRMLRYKRINTHFFMDTFFVTGKAISQRGHKCMQLFVSDKGFVYVVPMKDRKEIPKALKEFAKEIGVPVALIFDMSGEQTSNEMKKIAGDMDLTLKMLERSTQWANLAELYIGLMKEAVRKDMKDSNSPLKFWDYCAERRAQIHNLTAKDLFQMHGSNPITATFGDEGDISNLCEFAWFDWCYYCNKEDFTHQEERLGRVLGPAKNEGNEMS